MSVVIGMWDVGKREAMVNVQLQYMLCFQKLVVALIESFIYEFQKKLTLYLIL